MPKKHKTVCKPNMQVKQLLSLCRMACTFDNPGWFGKGHHLFSQWIIPNQLSVSEKVAAQVTVRKSAVTPMRCKHRTTKNHIVQCLPALPASAPSGLQANWPKPHWQLE